MPSHIVRVLCEARSQSRSVRDAATGETPFAWRGSDLTFQLGLTDNGQHLLRAGVGQIIVEVKALTATSADNSLMRKEFVAADCDATFVAADWTGGGKQLLAASFSKAEAALPPGTYRFIVRHIAPDDSEMTYISAEFRLLDPQSGNESLDAPPVAWSYLEGLPVVRTDFVQSFSPSDQQQARENIGIDATSFALSLLAGASNAAAARTLLGAASLSGSFETWVIEGDSWSAGTAEGNSQETWPYYIAKMIGPRVNIVNAAVAGQTIQTMVSQFATQCAPHLTATSGKPSTFFLGPPINDASTRTTAEVRTDLRTLWTNGRNAGARVVAFTLPYRTASGGWSQADWKTINDNIIADASYYDALVRLDVFHSTNAESSDQLHISTEAHAKLASRVMDALAGRQMTPSLPSDFVCYKAGAVTFTGGTRRNMPFSELYDANDDGSTATVGSDANTSVFTAPCSGTYDIYANVCLSGLASGDSVYTNAWITPLGGSEAEHRLDYQISAGGFVTTKGQIRRRLNRGDTVSIAIVSSKTSSATLTNDNNAAFQVRLVSIP